MDNNKLENGVSNLAFQQGDTLPQEDLLQTALHIVLRHRWTILAVTVLSLVVTFLYLLKATPIYTSSSRVYVEQSGPKIMSEYEGVMTQSTNYLYTQGEFLQRRIRAVPAGEHDPQIDMGRNKIVLDVQGLVQFFFRVGQAVKVQVHCPQVKMAQV